MHIKLERLQPADEERFILDLSISARNSISMKKN